MKRCFLSANLKALISVHLVQELLLSDWAVSDELVGDTVSQVVEIHISSQVCTAWLHQGIMQFVLLESLQPDQMNNCPLVHS